MESEFKSMKTKSGFTSRMSATQTGKSYEQVYWDFISQRYGDKVTSWKMFDSAKALMHTISKLNVWEPFASYCQGNVDFLEKGLSNETVIGCMHLMTVTVVTNCEKFMDKEDLACILLEALKFTVPAVGESDAAGAVRRPPWTFDKSKPDLIGAVLTPMTNSKVYNTEQKTKDKSEEHQEEAAPKKKPRRSATRDSHDMEEEVMNIVAVGVAGKLTRDKLWLDDLVTALNFTLKALEPKEESGGFSSLAKKSLSAAKAHAISLALEFAWTGQVKLESKTLLTWSLVRKALQGMLVKTYTSVSVVSAMNSGSLDDLAKVALEKALAGQTIDGDQDSAQVGEEKDLHKLLAENEDLQASFYEFMSKNKVDKPFNLHPACNKLQTELSEHAQQMADNRSLEMLEVVSVIGQSIFKVFRSSWMEFVGLASDILATKGSLPQKAVELFGDEDKMVKVGKLRGKYLLAAMKLIFHRDSGINVVNVNKEKLVASLYQLADDPDMLCIQDIALAESEWNSFWSSFFLQAAACSPGEVKGILSITTHERQKAAEQAEKGAVRVKSEEQVPDTGPVAEATDESHGEMSYLMTYKEIYKMDGDPAMDCVLLQRIPPLLQQKLWQTMAENTYNELIDCLQLDLRNNINGQKTAPVVAKHVAKDMVLILAGPAPTLAALLNTEWCVCQATQVQNHPFEISSSACYSGDHFKQPQALHPPLQHIGQRLLRAGIAGYDRVIRVLRPRLDGARGRSKRAGQHGTEAEAGADADGSE